MIEVRKVAASKGKTLNQIIRERLERLTHKQNRKNAVDEFKVLTGLGNSKGWTFIREEL